MGSGQCTGGNGGLLRLEGAGSTELVVNSSLTVGTLDSVDKLTIAENNTLNITDSFSYDRGFAIDFDLGEDGFDGKDWTVLTGVSLKNLTQAEFFIGGNKLTFDDNGVYTGENFQLKLEENKLTMLGISKN